MLDEILEYHETPQDDDFVAGVIKSVQRQQRMRRIILTVTGVVGASFAIGADPIMAAMFLGFTFVNLAPVQAKNAFKLLAKFAAPIFVLFFVMAGSRLQTEESDCDGAGPSRSSRSPRDSRFPREPHG